jgi:D-glycero-alpha-D-manno-heptose-7-phosphate kinase
MDECTAGQAELHPELVSHDAWQAIEVARSQGALGWKVNGAGGEGGSLSLLCGPQPGAARRLAAARVATNPGLRPIPIRLCPWGARAWDAS